MNKLQTEPPRATLLLVQPTSKSIAVWLVLLAAAGTFVLSAGGAGMAGPVVQRLPLHG